MREAQDTNQEVGVCVHHHLCQQSGGCALCRGGGWGLTHPQAAILTTDLSDGEACVHHHLCQQSGGCALCK